MAKAFAPLAAALVILLMLTGCGSDAPNGIGEAYVAPAHLNLHASLMQRTNTVAVLQHGDHLRILDVKRRFVQVRTDKDVEGWVDSRQLLSKQQMKELIEDSRREVSLPSMGSATVFDALNMHIEPDRLSAAFGQIPAATSVSVLAHKAAPKTTAQPSSANLAFTKAPAPPPKRSRKRNKTISQRPQMPPAPKPPQRWLEMSSERINGPTDADLKKEAEQNAAKEEAKSPSKPVVLEDWSLVRTKDKKVGWVLSRNLYMSIPDDVAQYAEGQRISSYFDLGLVVDDVKGNKHNWLWTTASQAQPFDFDKFRIFYWNRRRHRYETAYRQRDLVGYFPVEVEPAQPDRRERFFSLIFGSDAGKYVKKRYVFDGALVRLVSSDPYEPPAGNAVTKAAPLQMDKIDSDKQQAGWLKSQLNRLSHLFKSRN
jgi:GW (Gly-Tryp) dipeptide domain